MRNARWWLGLMGKQGGDIQLEEQLRRLLALPADSLRRRLLQTVIMTATIPFLLEQMKETPPRGEEPPPIREVTGAAAIRTEEMLSSHLRHIDETTIALILGMVASGASLQSAIGYVLLSTATPRAAMLARTFTTLAANVGRVVAIGYSDTPNKRWNTQGDGKVRHLHLPMDGQVVPADRVFLAPNGETGFVPGAFTSPEMNANCRCFITGTGERTNVGKGGGLGGMSKSATTPWTVFSAGHTTAEPKVRAAINLYLTSQGGSLLAQLPQEAAQAEG